MRRQGGARIKSVVRRDETTLRLNDLHGNFHHHGSFHMTWAADDKQYVTLNDGYGCCEDSNVSYSHHMFALSGGPQGTVLHDVPGYPRKTWETAARDGKKAPWYNGWGTLALDRHIYVFVSTFNHPLKADGIPRDTQFIGAKLVYSPDNGRTWHNQDGSTPVVWEAHEGYSRETLTFFEEPQGAFSLLSILQMGRNYEANRDGYIYVYSPNGNSQETMNELVMFRVPKGQLLRRTAYEYFAGLRSNGNAAWVKDITARSVVHTFPRGWVGRSPAVPFGWFPSVVYNAPLGLYLMANWGQGWAPDQPPDQQWFGKPSYLGFWVAQNPWGPWTQIHEETAWLPSGDQNARAYQPQIAPKWIAADGKSFWLAWPDFQTDQEASRRYKEELTRITTRTPEVEARLASLSRKVMPYYGINAQRVDLILT